MKPRIYFSIETKIRELNARVLFALKAAQKGYSVVIGARGNLTRFRKYLKTGVLLSNGHTLRLASFSKSFSDLGFNVGQSLSGLTKTSGRSPCFVVFKETAYCYAWLECRSLGV